jgi:hypothetical protein
MKRIICILMLILLIGEAPARAQVSTDAPILTMMLSENKVFHSFMQLQVVQEIATLKANYDASVQYFNDFKRLNAGKGIVQNVGQQIKAAQQQENQDIQNQLTQQLLHPTGRATVPGQLFQAIEQMINGNIKYAGDETANLISNRQMGVNVAQNANGLAPKDAANLTAQAQGLQIQQLVGIHEDNLRIIQLLSMMLSQGTHREEGEQKMIGDIQQSLQNRGLGNTGAQ